MSFADYFEWYILYIPFGVYGWGIAAFLLILVSAIIWKGTKEGVRYGAAFLLAEYVALLLYFTVFMWRGSGRYEYALVPFWSYKAMLADTRVLMQEVVMNIAVFIPIGFLAGLAMKNVTWQKVAITGFAVSLTIELLQLLLKRGCCETDDVINNTLGCMLGYGVLLLFIKVIGYRLKVRE